MNLDPSIFIAVILNEHVHIVLLCMQSCEPRVADVT